MSASGGTGENPRLFKEEALDDVRGLISPHVTELGKMANGKWQMENGKWQMA
jgi:hypothetical protein